VGVVTTAALQDMFLPGNRCFGCGPANPEGLHLKTYEDGDGFVAEWTPEAQEIYEQSKLLGTVGPIFHYNTSRNHWRVLELRKLPPRK
jgi:hypothetical protein